MNNKESLQERQFAEVVDIIAQRRSHASQVVNKDTLLTAWHVGGYVSHKLKSEEWGSKVVTKLSEYIRSQCPDFKGYSRRNIYNMVMFFEEYSSESFSATVANYLNSDFAQPRTAQLENGSTIKEETSSIVQSATAQLAQPMAGLMPNVLTLTTLTNRHNPMSRSRPRGRRICHEPQHESHDDCPI